MTSAFDTPELVWHELQSESRLPYVAPPPHERPLSQREQGSRDLDARLLAFMVATPVTLEEVGQVYGVTRERIRQRINRAQKHSPLRRGTFDDPIRFMQAVRDPSVRSFSDLYSRIPDSQAKKLLTELGVRLAVKRLFRMRHRAAVKADYINRLRIAERELGRTVVLKDAMYGRLGISLTIVYRLFGSWPAYRVAAGLQPSVQGQGTWKHARYRARPFKRVTHCLENHEMTPENTYVHKTTGHRQCRTCMRDRIARDRDKYGRPNESD